MPQETVPVFDVTQNRGWKVDLRFAVWVTQGSLCGAVRGDEDVIQTAGSAADYLANLNEGVVGLAAIAVTVPLGLLHASLNKKAEDAHQKTTADFPNGNHLEWNPQNFRLEVSEIELVFFAEAPNLLSPKAPTQKMQLRLRSGETRHFTLARGENGGQLELLLEENGIKTERA